MKLLWQKNNRIMILPVIGACLIAGLFVKESYAYFVNERYEQTVLQMDLEEPEWGFLSDVSIVDVLEEEIVESEVAETESTEVEVQEETASEEASETTSETPETVTPTYVTVVSELTEKWPLILRIDYPEGYNEVHLGFNGGGFPSETYYSLDGKTSFQLDGEDLIRLPETEAGTDLLLIYFEEGVAVEEYVLNTVFYNDEGSTIEIDMEEVVAEREAWSIVLNGSEPVLRGTGNLKWNITSSFSGITYDVEMEYLTIDGFVQAKGIEYTLTEGENGVTVLQLTNGEENQALAGTYQMTITQIYSPEENLELQLQKMVIPFFVNYKQP